MLGKISIYQVLPRLFGNINNNLTPNGTLQENGVGKFSDFTEARLTEIKNLGVTHIWFTGILDHATGTDYPDKSATHPEVLKGIAGSPYAIRDYYDIAPDLADNPNEREQEYRSLIDRCHRIGLKVIQDFVPNHVSRTYHSTKKPPYIEDFGEHDKWDLSFDKHNNFYYIPGTPLTLGNSRCQDFDDPHSSAFMEYPAKATGNDVFNASPSSSDWYETVKLNYGWDPYTWQEHYEEPVPDTWNKILDILLYWSAMGIDGFRCDMVGMVPTAFWEWVIKRVRTSYPQMNFIGELYEPDRYSSYISAGFDYLYDKVGLYDTLIRVLKGIAPTSDITKAWQETDGMSGHLLHFLENHDEQRLASDFIIGNPMKALPALAVSVLIDTSPVLTYFGQELGEKGMDEEGYSGRDGRTSIFDYWSIDTVRRWICGDSTGEELALRTEYQKLLTLATQNPVFGKGLFFDVMYANLGHLDSRKHYAFLRAFDRSLALVVVNFSDTEADLKIQVPELALETFMMHEGMVGKIVDPLTNRIGVMELQPILPFPIKVPAHGVAIRLFSTSC